MPGQLLSKTKYMNGLQCPKLLWFICNDPEKVSEPDASTQSIFDQGHLVGELAKKLFPEGIDVPHDDFKLNLSRTQQLLSQGRTLFEAGLMKSGLYSRLDILKPVGEGEWDIIEVKSSTGVKEENYHDVSFQKLCAENCGLTINKCYLVFINNQYVRQGEIEPGQLFTIQDITAEAATAGEGIDGRIASMLETISSEKCPEVPVGSYCSHPYDCPVTWCREQLPENNIFNLYRGGKKCYDLFYSGILHIKDIPDDVRLSRVQEIQKSCDISGDPYIEAEAIREFLDTIREPVHYLDFETINPAVPLFDGVRPYQKVPFQFSLHIRDQRTGMRHYSYLAEGPDDPRPQFLQRLKAFIGPAGSIVTYNQPFEEGVLKDLAGAFPEHGEWIEGVRGRLVDLLRPFQSFSYYHPGQNGSASIKSVLPALTGKSYEGMAIGDGEAASRAFLNVTYGEATQEERELVRNELEKYCGLDTEGMVWIMEKLGKICDF